VLIALGVVILIGGITAIVVASSGGSDVADPSDRPAGTSGAACAPAVGSGPATVGAPAPEFRLRGLDGGCVDLASLRGHPVIVNFWASWCFPCREETPLLRKAYDAHHAEGLEIVGIPYRDIDADSRAFAAEFGVQWLIARDQDGATAAAYGVRPIPQSFFIRRDGTISGHVRGMTKADLDRELQKILAREHASS
jgi:cytochrome c biogenesis protein CcmG/thiol:disulfide interchange protein DsbE